MSLERIKSGTSLSGDCGSDPTKMPPWMDHEKFKRGQQFYIHHIGAATFALHCSVTVGFGIENFARVLAFTKQSDTPPKALNRYLKTFVHIVLWHSEDVWDPTTRAHRSTQAVRHMHKKVRNQMESEYPGQKFVSQYDMAVVQAGFMAVVVLYPKELGIWCTRQELEDYVFFWRGIGYLLGIQDEYNICSGSLDDVHRLCKEIERDVMYRGLLDPPPQFQPLADAYTDGINSMSYPIKDTKEAIIKLSLDTMKYPSLPWMSVTLSDRVRVFAFRTFLFMIRWMPGFERFFNWCSNRVYMRNQHLIDKELAEN